MKFTCILAKTMTITTHDQRPLLKVITSAISMGLCEHVWKYSTIDIHRNNAPHSPRVPLNDRQTSGFSISVPVTSEQF